MGSLSENAPWLIDSGIPWRRVILMSPQYSGCTQPDRSKRKGSQRDCNFVDPLWYSGYGSKGIVCKSYAGIQGWYAERTQDVRSTRLRLGRFLRTVFFLRFSRRFWPSLRGVSSFSQILGLSESRRQSPGWHNLDGNLAISWRVPPLRVRLVRNSLVPPPRRGSPSCWTTRFTLRAPFTSSGALGRLPWGTQGFFWDALNKEFSFREEVRPGSRRLLKACPFQ